jgi:hypothetical protein
VLPILIVAEDYVPTSPEFHLPAPRTPIVLFLAVEDFNHSFYRMQEQTEYSPCFFGNSSIAEGKENQGKKQQ